MMSHDEAAELLAVFALDAVDSREYDEIEAHLAECPRCRAELDAHREVAAALGNSVEPLPEGLWSSIASRLPPRPDEEPPPMPALLRSVPEFEPEPEPEPEPGREREAASAGSRFRTPRSSRLRASRGRLISVASFAVAAAAVAAVLAVNLVHDSSQISSLRNSSAASAVAALNVPGHKVVDVESAKHVELARFVVLPSGQGYLEKSTLPTLSGSETYQLWGVIDGRAISLGLLGQSPHGAAFSFAGSPRPSKIGITVEPAGGSVVPTGTMLAAGTV
jgi:anti-sigma-K factor RskA